MSTQLALNLSSTAGLSIAGAESNVAIGLARLGHSVDFASRVGPDQLASLITRTLSAEGVGIEHIEYDDAWPTGAIFFDRAPGGTPRVSYLRASSAFHRFAAAALDREQLGTYSLVHVSGISLALGDTARESVVRVAREAHAAGVPVSFDINHRSNLTDRAGGAENVASMLPFTRVLVASEDELPLLDRANATGGSAPSEAELVSQALRAGVAQVVVKRGERGASVFSADGESTATAHRVPVENVIGAGDAFCAGYLSAFIEGQTAVQALARGNLLGACAVASSGDWEGLPTRNELDRLSFASGEVQR